jgi:hypothetical protein
MERTRNVDFLLWNGDFLAFDLLSVTFTSGVATQLLRYAHCLIMVITCAKLLKKNQWFKSYGADTKCRLFIMKW